MPWSAAYKNKLANAILGDNHSVEIDQDWFLGLLTVMPDGAGVGATEVVGGSYGRKRIANVDDNWEYGGIDGVKRNANIIQFDSQATADWGTIVGFGFFTVDSGATPFVWDLFDVPLPINTGDMATLPVGALSLRSVA